MRVRVPPTAPYRFVLRTLGRKDRGTHFLSSNCERFVIHADMSKSRVTSTEVAARAALRSLYWQGLAIAGLFNFLPGRMVARSVFPNAPEIGIAIIVFGAIALIYIAWQQRRSGLRAA